MPKKLYKCDDGGKTIEVLLNHFGMTEYVDLLISKQKIDSATFINMTDEDMVLLGIESDHDRKRLWRKLKPYRALFEDVDNFPLLSEMIYSVLENDVNQLRRILGFLITLRRNFQENGFNSLIIDPLVPASSVMVELINKMILSVELIENDYQELKHPAKRKESKALTITTLSSAIGVAITVSLFYFKPKMPYVPILF